MLLKPSSSTECTTYTTLASSIPIEPPVHVERRDHMQELGSESEDLIR